MTVEPIGLVIAVLCTVLGAGCFWWKYYALGCLNLAVGAYVGLNAFGVFS